MTRAGDIRKIAIHPYVICSAGSVSEDTIMANDRDRIVQVDKGYLPNQIPKDIGAGYKPASAPRDQAPAPPKDGGGKPDK